MKKIHLLLLTMLCFFGFNRSVYAVLTEADVSGVTCEELEKSGKLADENLLFDASGYSTNCVYVVDGSTRCIVLQTAFNLDGTSTVRSLHSGDDDLGAIYPISSKYRWLGQLWVPKEINGKYFADRGGLCPKKVSYDTRTVIGGEDAGMQGIFCFDGQCGSTMDRIHTREHEIKIPQLIIEDPNASGDTCIDILGEDGVNLLKTIKNLIMIFVPILLLVLAIVDIVSAMFSGDENNIKKAQGKLFKRFIIAIVIFLIPVVLGFLLDIVNAIWPNLGLDFCGVF